MTTHRARWGLADAGVHSRTYRCQFCDATAEVSHPGGVGADRVRLPAEEQHPDRAEPQWSLPHMEKVQPPATREDLLGELTRAEAELGNAIAMHRSAWLAARERRDELDLSARGEAPRNRAAVVAALCETDPKYSRRIADVKFWLAERAGLAATVSALVAMIQVRPKPGVMPPPLPPPGAIRTDPPRQRRG